MKRIRRSSAPQKAAKQTAVANNTPQCQSSVGVEVGVGRVQCYGVADGDGIGGHDLMVQQEAATGAACKI